MLCDTVMINFLTYTKTIKCVLGDFNYLPLRADFNFRRQGQRHDDAIFFPRNKLICCKGKKYIFQSPQDSVLP